LLSLSHNKPKVLHMIMELEPGVTKSRFSA